MAFNVGTGLDFGSLKKMPVRKRIELLRDRPDGGVTELSRLTPAQFAELFPRYWEKRLPDIGGFQAAISKKFIQRQEDINTGLAKKVGTTVEEAEKIGRTERLKKGVPDVMDAPSRVDKSKTRVESTKTTDGKTERKEKVVIDDKKVPELSDGAKKAWEKIQKDDIPPDSPEGKIIDRLSEKQKRELGISIEKDKNGNNVYHYTQPTAGKEEVESRFTSDYKKGSEGMAGRKALQKMVYDGYRNAGFSDKQARALTAEVGRENSYNAATLFGTHRDPHNNQVNLGMISMQGGRGQKLFKYLDEKGLIDKNGHIKIGQESINAMAAFQKKEMQDGSHGGNADRVRKFLNSPEIDSKTAAEILGRDYIRWRYDDPKYSSGHRNRDQAAAELDKTLGEMKQASTEKGHMTKEQYDAMSEQIIKEKNQAKAALFARDMYQYENENNIPHVESTKVLNNAGYVIDNSGHIQPTDGRLFQSKNATQCATLTKAFNPNVGTAGGWKVNRNDSLIKPGVAVATSMYNDSSGGKPGAGYHTGIALTAPDTKGNFYILDQFAPNARTSGKAAVRRVNVNSYHHEGNYWGVINGDTRVSKEALNYAKKIGGPQDAMEQIDASLSYYEKENVKTAKPNAPELDSALAGNQPKVEPQKQQPAEQQVPTQSDQTVKIEKPTEPEKPKGPQSYSLNRQALVESIKQTSDYKKETANIPSFLISDDAVVDGFFKDARTKKIMQETGTTYDPATGKITSSNPDKLLKSFGDMNTSNILSPEKRAEATQTTQTATIGEKLQREFGVASAQAATGQGDAFAREEAYRKAHPYGPEMPTESKVTGGVSDKIEKTAGATGLRPNSKLIDYTSSATVPAVGISHEQYNAFRESIASIESRGGVYGLQGGGGKKYDGAYQFNANAKKDANKTLGANLPSREEFRKNPMLQEQLFDHYVAFNHRVLMQKSKIYRTLSPEKKLEVLGYAHNQGAGGAAKWLRTGQSHKDAFGTDATKYANTINKELAALRQSQALEATQLAQAETVKTTEAPKAATPEAPKTTSPLGPLGSGGAAAAETPVTPATPTTVEPTAQAKTPTATATPATPTTGGPEFPKNKSTETPLPPSRDVSAAPSTPTPSVTPTTVHQPTGAVTGTPQSGAPDESSTNSFLKSQGIPGASDGGNFKTGNQPISFYPMDKKDNIAAVNPITQQPLFTAKSGETVSVNPEQKIKLNDKPLDRVGSEIDSLKEQMTSIMERQAAGEPVRQATNKLMHETPQKPVTIDPFLKQKTVGFPTPSLERAMSRTRGSETGSGTDGHHFSRTSIA